MEFVFIQLAIILFVAFVVSYIIRIFNQPLIIGYIVTGVIISPYLISFGASKGIIDIFSKFGIAFLLFMVGMRMNPRIIKEVGTTSLIIGLVQMILTFAAGFFTSIFLGFNSVTSSYIGIAIAFSSTIIVMKLLSDTRQVDSLYGKISIGILIIQDVVAIGVLMFISSVSSGGSLDSLLVKSLLGGGGLIVLLFLMGFFVLPRLIRSIAGSQELLFLFSITWAFVVAALFSYIGFSIEIGALIAGMVLSISPYTIEIASRIRPLRDFFLIIFFIILGFNIHILNIGSIMVNALIFSLIALIFKPLILIILTALSGYTKRTNILVGLTLGQISEFSLIVLALGVATGQISEKILSTLTLTGIITIAISAYMIIYSNKIYKKFSNFTYIFERKKIRREKRITINRDTILFGYNRIGFIILRALKRIKKNYVVVDFNPDVISILSKFKIPSIYGDAFDTDFLDRLPLDKIKLVISTIPDLDTNVILIESVRKVNSKAVIIARAHLIKDALKLYEKGANYVLTPHFLGGEYVAKMISNFKTDKEDYVREKKKHMKMLEEAWENGKKYPDESEKN